MAQREAALYDRRPETQVPELNVTPLSSALGATVTGIALADSSTDQAELIADLLAEHLVLVFPGQALTSEQHVQFASHFGEPYIHPFLEAVPESPAILQVLKEPEDVDTFGGEYWHCDISFEDPPAAVSLLHAKEIPSIGGDTLFANQELAFSQLSNGMKEMLRGLSAHHTYPDMDEEDDHASAIHPVVRRHPRTGRESLFVNAAFVSRFDDMTVQESTALLEFLFDHQVRPEFQARVTWSDDALVMWDNRATLHYAMNDYSGVRRRLERVTAMERDRPFTG